MPIFTAGCPYSLWNRHWDAYFYVKMGIQDAQFLRCLYLLDTGIADTIMSVVSSLQRKVWQCLVAGKVELVSGSWKPAVLSGCGDFCIKVPKFLSWEEIMSVLPWVTHGKDLCQTRHQLLLGRNYVKHATSYLWGGILQNTPPVTLGEEFCKTRHQLLMGRNYATHKSFIIYNLYTIFMEGFMQNSHMQYKWFMWLWISLTCTAIR